MEAASGGCKQTRTDFCNTSYTKLILSGRLQRTRTDFCNTSYTKLTLSGWLQTNPNGLLQHLLYEIDTFGFGASAFGFA